MQENTQAVLRRQMKHVMFTEPEVPRAGERLSVYYNPTNTVLAGRPSVYLNAGFDRWQHRSKIGPIQLLPPGPQQGDHHRVSGGGEWYSGMQWEGFCLGVFGSGAGWGICSGAGFR